VPYTIWGAFDQFRKQTVDLDAEAVKRARASRDYLFEQIQNLASKILGFPRLSGGYLSFGSFARKTKVQTLDDIDMLILINGSGTRDNQSTSDPYGSWLKITASDAPLSAFPDQLGYVNSTKVLNKIRDSLSTVPQYSKAEIHKNQQAVTLDLLSYPWVFDVVPAVPVTDGNRTLYYLIPNGRGDWIRTDPRIDSDNISRTNTLHSGEFLPLMRLVKYWNDRPVKPILGSYYFETLVIKVFSVAAQIKEYPEAIKYFFDACPIYISGSCPDPKGLGPNLDASYSAETKSKVIVAMQDDSKSAGYALMYKGMSDEKNAIYWWGRVFGSGFPTYG
jgi:hypothetical protein